MSHWQLFREGRISLKEARELQGLKLAGKTAEYRAKEKEYRKRKKK